jgi:hypothetical protein
VFYLENTIKPDARKYAAYISLRNPFYWERKHLQEECMLAQIPPNIENNPQNNGRDIMPSGVGSLAGNRLMPQAAK